MSFFYLSYSEISHASKQEHNNNIKKFIIEFSKESTYSKKELKEIFSKVEIQTKAQKESKNQSEFKLTWNHYKKILITQSRIDSGIKFLKEYKKTFNVVEKKYGVEREIIASIIGIESNYGMNLGNYRAIDALSTMSFKVYKNSVFFKAELRSFLVHCKRKKYDCFNTKSSWAGAIGYGQFIPTSIVAYGVDFNKNGKIDLVNEPEDAIASIANYLKKHKWKKGDLVIKKVSSIDNRYKVKLTNKLNLNTTIQELNYLNVKNIGNIKGTRKVKLFEMNNKYNNTLWIGFSNFKSITHYNKSNFYASAVYFLSKEIKNHNNVGKLNLYK